MLTDILESSKHKAVDSVSFGGSLANIHHRYQSALWDDTMHSPDTLALQRKSLKHRFYHGGWRCEHRISSCCPLAIVHRLLGSSLLVELMYNEEVGDGWYRL